MRLSRTAPLLVALVFVLAACATPANQAPVPQVNTEPVVLDSVPATATAVPTVEPTPEPVLGENIRVAGVDVGGLTPEQAITQIEEALSDVLRPLELRAGSISTTLRPEQFGVTLPLEELIAEALSADSGARIGLQVQYDETRLRSVLADLSAELAQPASVSVLTSTDTISRSFAVTGGEQLDIDAAVAQIDERLHAPGSPRRITLELLPDSGANLNLTPADLQEQLEALAAEWNGIVGVYVHDLASNQQIAGLNTGTAFSAASTIKAPILLNAYINIEEFDEEQEEWIEKMVVESDNLAANDLLSAAVGGYGTEVAFTGAEEMSALLADLGFPRTYQYVPFESGDFIRLYNVSFRTGPARDGAPPYTESVPTLRTTPEELGQMYALIYQCANGEGMLLERFDTLSPERCEEMIGWLEQNNDATRMMSGLPTDARVAHKSGWIDDMQADAGIVYSPGGDFVVSIFIYRELQPGQYFIPDEVIAPVIGDFARLVYSYYNPVRLAE